MSSRDSRFQVVSFFEQFPFLTTGKSPIVANLDEVDKVRVSRISPELLSVIPQYQGSTGSLCGINDSEHIFLLNKQGKVLVRVRQGGIIRHNEAHSEDEELTGETVGEALLRIINPNIVTYAVRVHTGFVIQDHYSVGGYTVTLYKPPKEFSLGGWVKEKIARERTSIEATIAEIDAEAT